MKLIIISDLWGFDDATWLKNYVDLLTTDFDLMLFDVFELAEIDKNDLSELEIHSQFVDGGIDTAVTKLLQSEKQEVNVLAFSMGGTIAWIAARQGFKINHLYAISSTRLRYETEKPDGKIHLIFGEEDQFKPQKSWFEKFNLKVEVLKNEDHEVCKKFEFIKTLCHRIKTDLKLL